MRVQWRFCRVLEKRSKAQGWYLRKLTTALAAQRTEADLGDRDPLAEVPRKPLSSIYRLLIGRRTLIFFNVFRLILGIFAIRDVYTATVSRHFLHMLH